MARFPGAGLPWRRADARDDAMTAAAAPSHASAAWDMSLLGDTINLDRTIALHREREAEAVLDVNTGAGSTTIWTWRSAE